MPKSYRRRRNNPCSAVPEELLLKAYIWEGTRERYFTSLNRLDDALEANFLKAIYSRRLWEECSIRVEPIDP